MCNRGDDGQIRIWHVALENNSYTAREAHMTFSIVTLILLFLLAKRFNRSPAFWRTAAFSLSGLSLLIGITVVAVAIAIAVQDHVPNFAGQRSQVWESTIVTGCVLVGVIQAMVGVISLLRSRRSAV
jgi:hypothetical protein